MQRVVARLVDGRLHVEGGDEIQQNFYTLEGRLLRVSEGIRDGFTVRVSAEPAKTALCASMKAKTTR